MNETYEFDYHFECTKRLYDLALGVFYMRKTLLKHKSKPKPYTRTCIETACYAIPFLIISALGFLLDKSDSPFRVLYYISAFIGAFFLVVGVFGTISTHLQLNDYQKRTSSSGKLAFDALGICDSSADGTIVKRPWSEYACCIVTDEVIVLLFESANIIFVDARPEYVSFVGAALRQFGKEDTIHFLMENKK